MVDALSDQKSDLDQQCEKKLEKDLAQLEESM